jgi:hypothetical protein
VIRLPIVLLAATLALAAGCGGGGSSASAGAPPAQWAASVCGALQTWQTSLQSKAQGLTQDVLQAQSPKAAKQQLGDFLDEVIAETDTMIASVGKVGQPAVDQGDQVARDFRAGLDQMRAAFADAKTKIEQVPTDDPQAFQQQLTAIGQELQTQGQSIGSTLGNLDEKYNAPELGKAFDENANCKAITG